jgi:hypothetical protein
MTSNHARLQVCLGIVASVLLGSCGGGKTMQNSASGGGAGEAPDGAPPCRASSDRISSTEAATLAVCRGSVPPGVMLAELTTGNQMDVNGGAWSWAVRYVDSTSRTPYWVEVKYDKNQLVSTKWPRGQEFHCLKEAPAQLSSTVIVPDALTRLTKRGIDVRGVFEAGNAIALFHAAGECPPLSATQLVTVKLLESATANPQNWWTVYYDTLGHFQRTCGPCAKAEDPNCTACSDR